MSIEDGGNILEIMKPFNEVAPLYIITKKR